MATVTSISSDAYTHGTKSTATEDAVEGGSDISFSNLLSTQQDVPPSTTSLTITELTLQGSLTEQLTANMQATAEDTVLDQEASDTDAYASAIMSSGMMINAGYTIPENITQPMSVSVNQQDITNAISEKSNVTAAHQIPLTNSAATLATNATVATTDAIDENNLQALKHDPTVLPNNKTAANSEQHKPSVTLAKEDSGAVQDQQAPNLPKLATENGVGVSSANHANTGHNQGSQSQLAPQSLISVDQPVNQNTMLFATAADKQMQLSVQQPVGHAAWGNALGDQVLFMTKENLSTAEIRLHPPELGPLQAHVNVNNNKAEITFVSHHGVVRDALEANMPKLRELFEQSGLVLVNVSVSDQNAGQQMAQNQRYTSVPITNVGAEEPAADVTVTTRSTNHMVDYYA